MLTLILKILILYQSINYLYIVFLSLNEIFRPKFLSFINCITVSEIKYKSMEKS
jgi:hypothetical protein